MDAARDLVGAGRIERHVFGRIARVHGKAWTLERVWPLCAAVTGAICAQADGMRCAGSGWIGEMHRLPHLDGDARRGEICRNHAYLIRAGRPLAAGAQRKQYKGQERPSATHACLHGGMTFRAPTDLTFMKYTLLRGPAAGDPGAGGPARVPRC